MLIFTPVEAMRVTRISCPACNTCVPNVGLMKDSEIKGLSFTCKKCKLRWELRTTK